MIGFSVIVSIVWIILTITLNLNMNNKNIVIKVDNKIVNQISINEYSENQTYSFKFGENIGYIEVNDGAVRMLKMYKLICPKEICSNTGWISKKYETIICLPNGIIVNIEENKESGIDLVTF